MAASMLIKVDGTQNGIMNPYKYLPTGVEAGI